MDEERLLGRQRCAAARVVETDAGRHRLTRARVLQLDVNPSGRGSGLRRAAARDGQVAERDAAARADGQIRLQQAEAREARAIEADRGGAQTRAGFRRDLLRHAVAVAAVPIPRDGERLRPIGRVGHRDVDVFVDVERVPIVHVEDEQIAKDA